MYTLEKNGRTIEITKSESTCSVYDELKHSCIFHTAMDLARPKEGKSLTAVRLFLSRDYERRVTGRREFEREKREEHRKYDVLLYASYIPAMLSPSF